MKAMTTIFADVKVLVEARPADMLAFEEALALMGVREFEFFRIAWREWHGADAEPKIIEQSLMACLYAQETPPWVRYLVRRVNEDAEIGVFDRRRYGLPAARPDPLETALDWRWSFGLMAAAMLIIFFVFPFLRSVLGLV